MSEFYFEMLQQSHSDVAGWAKLNDANAIFHLIKECFKQFWWFLACEITVQLHTQPQVIPKFLRERFLPTHMWLSCWESLVIFVVMYMRSSDCPLVNNGNYFQKLTTIVVMRKSCCCWFRVHDTESQVNTRSSVVIFSWHAMLKQTNKNVLLFERKTYSNYFDRSYYYWDQAGYLKTLKTKIFRISHIRHHSK